MELIFELLLELIVDGSIEISKNKKIPKYVRYPAIGFIVLFFAAVTLGLLALGIWIINKNIAAGILLILVGAGMLVLSIFKFKKIYAARVKNNNSEE